MLPPSLLNETSANLMAIRQEMREENTAQFSKEKLEQFKKLQLDLKDIFELFVSFKHGYWNLPE